MLLIQALKGTKPLFQKAADLERQITNRAHHMSIEGSTYENPAKKLAEFMQAHADVLREIEVLHRDIQFTNCTTMLKIDIHGTTVEKSISEWIVRRQKNIDLALNVHNSIVSNSHLFVNSIVDNTDSSKPPVVNSVVFNYDADDFEEKRSKLTAEVFLIDTALEIANATIELKSPV